MFSRLAALVSVMYEDILQTLNNLGLDGEITLGVELQTCRQLDISDSHSIVSSI